MAAPNQRESALAQQNGAYEPQRQYHWILRISDLPGSDVLELSLRAGNLPTDANEEIVIPMLNANVYVAGKQTVEAISFTYNDYVDVDTMGVIGRWRRLVYNPETQEQGYAANYKKTASLILYGPDYSVERVWELQGLWPMSATNGAISYESSEIVQIEVSFRYDRAIQRSGWVA